MIYRSLLCLTVFATLLVPVKSFAEEVNIYSGRKEALIKPALNEFTRQTGIKVNLLTGKSDALIKRLESEGKATPADVLLTVDVGRLHRAKQAGLLQPVSSNELSKLIPENLRDVDNQWFGLSLRARPIFYAKDRVDPSQLSTYENLADERWLGKICIRSSKNIYNQSLVASMLIANEAAATQQWLNGLVKNFARNPAGGDTDQLRAVAAGVCDIAVANTYYYGRLSNSEKAADLEVVEKVGLFWPNQEGAGARGTHINISGAGVTKHSRNVEQAVKLIEYLASAETQEWYARINNEYPVVADVASSKVLDDWGVFHRDSVTLSLLGDNNRKAVEMMDIAGWK